MMRAPITIVAGVVSLCALLVALVIGITATGGTSDAAPLVTEVIALVGITIPSMFALYKAEATNKDLRNGVLVAKVKQALTEHADEIVGSGAELVEDIMAVFAPESPTSDSYNNPEKESEQ